MALFDEEHRKWQEENGRKLRENLRATVNKGPQPGIMGAIGFNFANSLLNGLEKTDEQKARSSFKRSK